ncbi:MAG: hypothetical protein M1114_04630 [Candidatus Dependentiae bacterium]|nr:hypothetical protein [Candidatus Dependentiae bacterium]
MINNKILLVLLFFASIYAMDDNQVRSVRPAIVIEPSVANGWRPLWSHTENRLSPVIQVSAILNGEVDTPTIQYFDAKDNRTYYAHHLFNGDDGWKVTAAYAGSEQDFEKVLPFSPIHLALNKEKSILLIEGPCDVQILKAGRWCKVTNNLLVAYALRTKTLYQMVEYKAKNGHKKSVIGFKENAEVPTAVAEFDLTHQEWDLSVIEQ